LKPISWCPVFFYNDSIFLTNPSKAYCCINSMLQVVYRISTLKHLILNIQDTNVHENLIQSVEFIKSLAKLYNEVKVKGKAIGYYHNVVKTCYMASFYSLELFKSTSLSLPNRSGAYHRLQHHDPSEMFDQLIIILDNVYKYNALDRTFPPLPVYCNLSEDERIKYGGINAHVIKNDLAKFYCDRRQYLAPCSELFNIIILKSYTCMYCRKCTCIYESMTELEAIPPVCAVTMVTLKELLNLSLLAVEQVTKECSCKTSESNTVHVMRKSIVRCPNVLLRKKCCI